MHVAASEQARLAAEPQRARAGYPASAGTRAAVKGGLARRSPEVGARLGVDEKAIAKRHLYLTVVADLERSGCSYLADDRKQASLDGFWPTP